jgi:small subunit ribosomal protein S17
MVDNAAPIKQRKGRKTMTGVVTSAHQTPKTISVKVHYRVRHRKYGKYMRRSIKLHAHDDRAEAKLGDRVQLMECRPISKTKTWRLVKVLASAP